jgi:hypothetical protein
MKALFVRWLVTVLFVLCVRCSWGAPTIIITNLPAHGSTNDLAGVVFNGTPGAYAVAVFIYVPGFGWVSKPTCAQPLSVIQSNGNWSADITTGGADPNATRIAALVVNTNYNQPCVVGSNNLPTNVFAQSLASAVATRQSPGLRWLSFSGYDWWAKTSSGPVGPGPNYFSDSTNNVWVDGLGQLHLRITNRSNLWQCAELVTGRTFGNGNYRFELASRVDNLDPNIVLGLFTWSDDPAYADREIDVELSRWGNPADTNNAQFVVQPYQISGHLLRFAVPAGQTNSTQSFRWETNQATFQSLRGSFSSSPVSTNVTSSWTNTLGTPQTGDENIRINFWLSNGNSPSNNSEAEVVIKSFDFVPLGTPQPALLKNVTRTPGGEARFDINGQFDWRYRVQGSSNFVDWLDLRTFLATNSSIAFQDTNSGGLDRRFFRATTLP